VDKTSRTELEGDPESPEEYWCLYLMEAEVVLDAVRAEEDGSLSGHHQDEAVQGLQRKWEGQINK